MMWISILWVAENTWKDTTPLEMASTGGLISEGNRSKYLVIARFLTKCKQLASSWCEKLTAFEVEPVVDCLNRWGSTSGGEKAPSRCMIDTATLVSLKPHWFQVTICIAYVQWKLSSLEFLINIYPLFTVIHLSLSSRLLLKTSHHLEVSSSHFGRCFFFLDFSGGLAVAECRPKTARRLVASWGVGGQYPPCWARYDEEKPESQAVAEQRILTWTKRFHIQYTSGYYN